MRSHVSSLCLAPSWEQENEHNLDDSVKKKKKVVSLIVGGQPEHVASPRRQWQTGNICHPKEKQATLPSNKSWPKRVSPGYNIRSDCPSCIVGGVEEEEAEEEKLSFPPFNPD